MKILLMFLAVLNMLACAEKTPVNKAEEEIISKIDTVKVSEAAPNQNGRLAAHRRTEGDTIFRTIDALQLPTSISERLERESEVFMLEIKNFEKKEINATLFPADDGQNLSISEVFLNSESLGGPYGNNFNEKIRENGSVRIKISRNPMAEGGGEGSFRLDVK